MCYHWPCLDTHPGHTPAHHTQRISLGICKEEARAIHGETSKSKADLTRLAGAVGALM